METSEAQLLKWLEEIRQKRVRSAINDVIGHNTDTDSDEPCIKRGKRSKCDFCPPTLKRMSIYFCAKCKLTYC